MKQYKFQNKKVVDLIKEKEQIAKELNAMSEKWQKEDQIAKKLQMRMDRIKEKMIPIIADEVKKAEILEEFDIVQTAKYEKDLVVVEIVNELEIIKDNLRKRNEQSSEQSKEQPSSTQATDTADKK